MQHSDGELPPTFSSAMTLMPPSTDVPQQKQCVSCAYPLNVDSDIFGVLSRVKGMMSHVGYTVGRVLVEDSSESRGTKTVTLQLRPSSVPKHLCANSNDYPRESVAEQLPNAACRYCPSSCSTNSLCRANVCQHHETGHKGEEESESAPLSANPCKHENEHRKKHTHSHAEKDSGAEACVESAVRKCSHHNHRRRTASRPQSTSEPNLSQFSQPVGDPELDTVYHTPPKTRYSGRDVTQGPTASERRAERRITEAPRGKDNFIPNIDRHGVSTHTGTNPNDEQRRARRIRSLNVQDRTLQPRWISTSAQRGRGENPSGAACIPSVQPTEFARSAEATRMHVTFSNTEGARERRERTEPPQPSQALPSPPLVSDKQEKPDGSASTSQILAFATGKVTEVGSHANVSPLTCLPCDITFTTELELRRHQFMQHRSGKVTKRTIEGRFLCLMRSCSQSFVRRHVMERHFKSVHLLVREFPCPSCDKSFADSSTLAAHRSAVHEKRKPYVCDQCSSCFTQSSSLGKHRRRFHQEAL